MYEKPGTLSQEASIIYKIIPFPFDLEISALTRHKQFKA